MALWKEAKSPGDIVRQLLLYRRDARGCIELGDVRIQRYPNVVRVASFLPGSSVELAGCPTIMVPDKQMHFRFADTADAQFDEYVGQAYADGWQNYHPEQHASLRDAPAPEKSGGVTIDWMTGKVIDDDDS